MSRGSHLNSVIEANCKTMNGRYGQSGMFWTVRGATEEWSFTASASLTLPRWQ
jgi:hypothetical protein